MTAEEETTFWCECVCGLTDPTSSDPDCGIKVGLDQSLGGDIEVLFIC